MQGRHGLRLLFSSFPHGWPGIGLLLLRLAAGVSGLADGYSIALLHADMGSSHWVPGLLELLLGIVLLAGFLTPIAAALAAIRTLYIGLPLFAVQDPEVHRSAFALLYLATICAAIMLLGPGALSLDSRLFGRREIVIPKSRPQA
jgi:uncharacterized membrane protein YphA (DoxX/SURF4 family)